MRGSASIKGVRMIPPINMPSMHTSDSYRVKQYEFTLTDGTTIIKKLTTSIAAKEDKPRINIFDDDSFTVGQAPVVYKRVGDEWEEQFTFCAIKVIYSTTLEVIEGGKDDKGDEHKLADKDNKESD